ncbi:hypothetical protein CEXT_334951 [Caerostris extrusa]|uniref:Uncharacterized protein n=1 Tax=Caerostris extrusa TaxID=172846 RepID=A0AAV4TM01_CAEEX|nr:hypothetical protein CEXT_334951 [Caerostris extrusa]
MAFIRIKLKISPNTATLAHRDQGKQETDHINTPPLQSNDMEISGEFCMIQTCPWLTFTLEDFYETGP